MNRMELLVKQWDYCYEEEDWYPPLGDALRGVTAEQALWRPEGEAANTIWENVMHLTFYKQRFLRRLKGDVAPQTETNDETFAVRGSTEAEWREAVERLRSVHAELRGVLAGLDDGEFDRAIAGREIGLQATSLVMHDAYHTGQIVFVRKLQGSWPASRAFE